MRDIDITRMWWRKRTMNYRKSDAEIATVVDWTQPDRGACLEHCGRIACGEGCWTLEVDETPADRHMGE